MRLLDLLRPFKTFLPECEAPLKRQSFNDKLSWTAWSVFIYIVATQIPLYGAARPLTQDPFSWMRLGLGANQGTIMDIGMSPLITASMLMHILANMKVIEVNFRNREDREMYQSAIKMCALFLTFVKGAAFLLGGFYGPISIMGPVYSVAVVAQLVLGGLVIILLDELLQKGYGLSSGVNIFIATSICQNVIWKCFSPKSITTEEGS